MHACTPFLFFVTVSDVCIRNSVYADRVYADNDIACTFNDIVFLVKLWLRNVNWLRWRHFHVKSVCRISTLTSCMGLRVIYRVWGESCTMAESRSLISRGLMQRNVIRFSLNQIVDLLYISSAQFVCAAVVENKLLKHSQVKSGLCVDAELFTVKVLVNVELFFVSVWSVINDIFTC